MTVTPPGDERSSRPKRVLVIEDDELQRQTLMAMLSFASDRFVAQGLPPLWSESVGSAEEGYAKLHNSAFDLCLTDITLPGAQGHHRRREGD